MRRIAPFAALLVAACATTPEPGPTPAPATVRQARGNLVGLTATELFAQFGQPSFQVREGPGIKLQWVRGGCVLDAYLYPPAGVSGAERVTHIDTRRTSGDEASQSGCIATLGTR